MRGQETYDDKVVDFGARVSAMIHPELSKLKRYWEELRAGRLVPLRSEIDPREIASTLKYGFLLEHPAEGSVRFRLSGMGLNDLMGMDVRGMPLRALIAPADRAAFTARSAAIFKGPEIQDIRLVSDQINAPEMTARMLILPLRSDGGEVDRAIGCMATNGSIGTPPRRFRVLETLRTRLTGDIPETPERITTAGFHEDAESFRPEPPRPTDGKPYLRLVKSD